LKICRAVGTVKAVDLLAVLKALGDETRYAMYRELASSTRPLSTADLAQRLALHANTVRLHLERLRQAGLVEVAAVHDGRVGRPQHVYTLAPGAPGLGLDTPSSTLLAGLLGALAERVGATPGDASATGWSWGHDAARRRRTRGCVRALVDELTRLGFDPVAEADGDRTSVAFLHCPFRELAEAYPELVCNLHRGICEGVVDAVGGGSVEAFSTLYDRDPCHVTVAAGSGP
jgi:predicted ArsR family transcriptional regulator